MLPIFVVNLDRSTERKSYMSKHLSALGLKYEFFSAFDGAKHTDAEINELIDIKTTTKIIGSPLRKGEIGCAMSHKLLYEKMVKENIQEALILEDDCVVDKSCLDIIKSRENWVPKNSDVILFGWHCSPREMKSIPIDEKHSIAKIFLIGYGTYGYYITLKGAKNMLTKLGNKVLVPADILTGDPLYTFHNLYVIDPPVVQFKDDDSTIEDDDLFRNQTRCYEPEFNDIIRKKIVEHKFPKLKYMWYKYLKGIK